MWGLISTLCPKCAILLEQTIRALCQTVTTKIKINAGAQDMAQMLALGLIPKIAGIKIELKLKNQDKAAARRMRCL